MNQETQALRNAQYDLLLAHARQLGFTPTYSHETAIVFWGYDLTHTHRPFGPPFHLCFSDQRKRRRSIPHAIRHVWSGRLDTCVAAGGAYRVVAPEVAWAQVSSSLDEDTLIAIAGSFMCRDLARRVMTMDDLVSYVNGNKGFKGRSTCRRILPYLVANSDSPPEVDFMVLLARSGITGIQPNLPLVLDGRRYYLDAAIKALRIAFEYQGAYHADPCQMRRDAAKHNALRQHGWEVIYVTVDDLRTEATRFAFLALVNQVIDRQRHILGLAS